MRPVLVELGPWPLWALLPLAAALAAGAALWLRSERARSGQRRLSTADWLTLAGFVGAGTLLIWGLLYYYGPVPVRSYGVMLLVGLLAGLAWVCYSGRAVGLRPAVLVDFALFLLVGGILGARLVYVALDWSAFASAPWQALHVWEGGLAWHGGLGGGLLGAWLFARLRRIRFAVLADLGAPGLALGYALTRIGCFLNGCCYGHHTHGPWGVCFAPESEAAHYGLGVTGQMGGGWGPPLHPTQLYHAALTMLIFLALVWLRPYLRRTGHLFLTFLILSSMERFVVDYGRRDATARPLPFLPALTEAQGVSLVLIVAVGLFMLLTWPRGKPDPPETVAASRSEEGSA